MRPLIPFLWASFVAAGCAGAGAVRPESDPLKDELRALRRQNEELAARVESLSTRVDLLTVRLSRSEPARAPAATAQTAQPGAAQPASPGADAGAGASTMGGMPAGLTVIKVSPATPPAARGSRTPAAKSPRTPPPPVPTSVAIQDPDAGELDEIDRTGKRPLAAQAEGDLRQARALAGLARAHALEDFTSHFPQHPSADNALVEAAAAYADAGSEDAACSLAQRTMEEYPAGDARSDALEILTGCATRHGDAAEAQKLLDRLRADFPGTPAAKRAEARLSQVPGRGGETPSRELPARSGP